MHTFRTEPFKPVMLGEWFLSSYKERVLFLYQK